MVIPKPIMPAASLIVASPSVSAAGTALSFRTQKGNTQEKSEMVRSEGFQPTCQSPLM